MRAALRLPAFPRLLGAYAVSQLGDWAAEVALAVLVYGLTESPVAVAVTWLVHRCLLGLAAPLLVARLERHRPQRLLPALALAQAAIFAALALSAGRAGLAGILALVAADGLIAPVSRALVRSTIAAVTRPAGLLAEGNAAVNVAFTTNAMLAAAVGGILTATLGAPAALAFNALTFLAVAALLGSAPLPRNAGDDGPRGPRDGRRRPARRRRLRPRAAAARPHARRLRGLHRLRDGHHAGRGGARPRHPARRERRPRRRPRRVGRRDDRRRRARRPHPAPRRPRRAADRRRGRRGGGLPGHGPVGRASPGSRPSPRSAERATASRACSS